MKKLKDFKCEKCGFINHDPIDKQLKCEKCGFINEELKDDDKCGWSSFFFLIPVLIMGYFIFIGQSANDPMEIRLDRKPTCYLENQDTHGTTKDGQKVLIRHYVSCTEDLVKQE